MNQALGRATGRFEANRRVFHVFRPGHPDRSVVAAWEITDTRNGKDRSAVVLLENPTVDDQVKALKAEIGNTDWSIEVSRDLRTLVESMGDVSGATLPSLSLRSIIIPQAKVTEGILVRSTSQVWLSIVQALQDDWSRAYTLSWREWEELVAGAYKRIGYDEVILTPRSGDHGRDIIATRKGVGSVRILGSVKAYRPGRLITKEEVHALLGVVSADPGASKGIFTTTSDFAPNLLSDPNLAACVPYRLELMNGAALRAWLVSLQR